MKGRNILVELARFLFSILVVGYHVQMSMNNNSADFFENGALAVEFFFLVSGYFLARSIEKVNAYYPRNNAGFETLRFMKNKVKGILPAHLTAIVATVVIILVFDLSNAGSILLKGLPSVFLLQGGALWYDGYADALIVPEWYLSSMLISMLFLFPIGLLLRRKLQGGWIPLISVFMVIIPALAFGLPFGFNTNLVYFMRAWGELCVGMSAFYFSAAIARREFSPRWCTALKVVEIAGYCLPLVLGFIPVSASFQPACMAVTVIGVYMAISISFADMGVYVANQRAGKVFAFLGSISLAVYLFHPVIISLIDYAYADCALWAKMLIVLPSAILLAAFFRLACAGVNKLLRRFKRKTPFGVD